MFFLGLKPKKKLYGLKSQCIHDRKGRLINCIPGEKGSIHDFMICRSNISILRDILRKEQKNLDDSEEEDLSWSIIVGSGYQGLQNYVKAIMPHKKQKSKAFTRQQTTFNKELASQRVICERFYGRLKTKFRIMSSKFRNSREEYKIIFRLCAALTNFDIILHPL
jgi:DDE superfamily endonuclease